MDDAHERSLRRGTPGPAAVVVVALLVGALGGAVAGGIVGHRAGRDGAAAEAALARAGAVVTTAPVTTTSTTGSSSALDSLADVPAIAAAMRPSVVSIEAVVAVAGPFGRSSTEQSAGTGFVITADGQIVTNNHVIAGASSITVVLPDGARLGAALVGASSAEDLAVLHVDRTGLSPVRLGSSAELRVGETVVAIGNALALAGGPTVSMGIVSALGRSLTVSQTTYPDLVQTDAAISSGNSGGPLVDHEGKVVGINSAAATSSAAENIGFAIAIDHARPVLRGLGASI